MGHDNSAFLVNIRTLLIAPSSREGCRNTSRKMHSRTCYAGDSRVPRMASRSGFSRRRTRRERDEGGCVLYRGAVDWVFHIFRARPTGRPAAARPFARPTGRSDKSGLLAERWLPLRCFGARRISSLNPYKGLLRFIERISVVPPWPDLLSDAFYANFFQPRPTPLTARWYFIASTWPARSNHSCIIPSTRPLSSEPRKLFIDGADVKRITT